ncbi:AAA family ATPase [Pseudomonas orientalis]|uniref:AAA family ATPase n=1 Tax=Pseudomonas orientalis TaxID=76758 RepID=UPI001FAF8C41|nr:AAA family ATPase [Pseudomonas orientalis]UOB25541.1 AAA family ATPase [Pseudomonas orientalis]
MKVTLNNVKSITSLEFVIPDPGVWVVTGLNGSGKTSLFGALYRLGAQNAFQKYYRNNSSLDQVDSFSDARIEYAINGQKVTYKYGGQRWRATPRSNAGLLKKFPFSAVDYVEANGARIEPFPDEIKDVKHHAAKKPIRDFLSEVLGDEKWQRLCYVNTRRGAGSDAYLVPFTVRGKRMYCSEKNFSLGELCVFKLAKKITTAAIGSLLLIDEVEMALHPLAQVKLLQQVILIAKERKLTVLFSTHSATLIKNINRKNLIFLKPDSFGVVDVQNYAYPAQVLGEIAFDEEYGTDFIFYVEDKHAQILLDLMCDMYLGIVQARRPGRPLYKVVPVGGFIQVLEMLKSAATIFPEHVKRFALLDEDVKTESLRDYKASNNRKALDLFESAKDNLDYLPCTPEVGVVEMLEVYAPRDLALLSRVNNLFSGHKLNIKSICSSAGYKLLVKVNVRDRAKDRLAHIVRVVTSKTGLDELHVKRTIFSEYVSFKYSNNGELQKLLGPIFN